MTAAPFPAVRGWFDDPVLVRDLPWSWRCYAGYSRTVVNRHTGMVRGGSFLFRVLRRAAPFLATPRAARVQVGARAAWVDLRDQRCLWVFDELRGAGPEVGVLKALLQPGDTFLDVGANHGSFALLAAERVAAHGMVVAVEPQPFLARLIERSLGDLGTVRFEVHAIALGDAEGTLRLHLPLHGSGAANLFGPPTAARSRGTVVQVHRADAVLNWRAWPGKLVVKLDVEGSEVDFLRGARALLAHRRPAILFEQSPETARLAGRTRRDLITALAAAGYRRFAELDAFPVTVSDAGLDLTRQRNLVALWGDA